MAVGDLTEGSVNSGRGRSLDELIRSAWWVFKEVLASSIWIKPPTLRETGHLLGILQILNSPMVLPIPEASTRWGGESHSFGLNKKDRIWEGTAKMHLSPNLHWSDYTEIIHVVNWQLGRLVSPAGSDTLYIRYIFWEDDELAQKRNQGQHAQASVRDVSPRDK